LNFLAPARGSHLRGKGTVVKAGKRQVIVRSEVWSERDGEAPVLAAVATATIMPV
jgi:acyl-coenzyme A thioesterase PaaI-like protein